MKLFSPTEIASSKATELARDVRRTSDIKEALDKARTSLNDTKMMFDSTLADQRVKWLGEQEEALLKIQALNLELEKLKEQREILLIPIDLQRKRIDNILMEANEIHSQAIQKQKDADEMVEKLEERLDEVSEKDEALTQREKTLFVKEGGCEVQKEAISKSASELTKQMQSFVTDMENKENVFNTKKKELEIREISVQEKMLEIEAGEKHLAREKQLIFSQRQALKAAFENYDKRTKR